MDVCPLRGQVTAVTLRLQGHKDPAPKVRGQMNRNESLGSWRSHEVGQVSPYKGTLGRSPGFHQ